MTFKEYRIAAGFTQEELAKVSDYSIQQIRKVEQKPFSFYHCSYAFVCEMWTYLVLRNHDVPFVELSDFVHEIILNEENIND